MSSNGVLPAVSVVIPHLNDSTGLSRALLSIRRQTLQPETTIVIDDASDAMIREQVAECVSLHRQLGHSVELLVNPNRLGPGASRNRGWSSVGTELVAFLDSDDEWHRQKLEIQVRQFAENSTLALSCHDFGLGPWDEQPRAVVKKLTSRDWLLKNWAPTPTVVLRSTIKFRFPEDRFFSEDYELWLNIALAGLPTQYSHARLARPDKPNYGYSGLSSKLVKMERGELQALNRSMRNHGYNAGSRSAASVWSIVKFVRRLFVVFGRSMRFKKGVKVQDDG